MIESEINDADSLNAWIGPYEQAEERLQIAEQKFEDTLRRLDEYKHGMGERLRKVSNAILVEDFYELLDPLRAKHRAGRGRFGDSGRSHSKCRSAAPA
jgi:hypothetical protein